jgi:hypothetical protein
VINAIRKLSQFILILTTAFATFSSAFAAAQSADPAAASGLDASGMATIRQVIADRPAMASFINRSGHFIPLLDGDPLMIAAAKLFADGTHPTISWSKDLPSKQCEIADHSMAHPKQSAVIRLSQTERCDTKATAMAPALGFEHLWSGLFFEFFNIQNDAGFEQIFEDTKAGKLSECEFVEENTKLEYLAQQKLRTFYLQTFSVWAKKNGFWADPGQWNANTRLTYKQWIAQYKNPNDYPWDYWTTFYKTTVVPYLASEKIAQPTRSCPDLPTPRADAESNSQFIPAN